MTATRDIAGLFDAARALDIGIGTDGNEVVLLASTRVPSAILHAFEKEIGKHKQQVIAFIVASEGTG